MYIIFKSDVVGHIKAIEQCPIKEQAIARMEYLAINNIDPYATGYYVESGDLVRIAEWEV